MEKIGDSELIRDDEVFLRMNLAERIQHIILFSTFFSLMITGLPLMFYEMKFFKSVFTLEKSFYIRGILHRAAAVTLIVNVVWAISYTAFTKRGRQNFREMIPGFRDIRDALSRSGTTSA